MSDLVITEPLVSTCECCDKPVLLYPNNKKKGFIIKDVVISEVYKRNFYVYDRRNSITFEMNDYNDLYSMVSSLQFATVYDTKEEAMAALDALFPKENVCRDSMAVINYEEENKKAS
jgi:hypothetical protein